MKAETTSKSQKVEVSKAPAQKVDPYKYFMGNKESEKDEADEDDSNEFQIEHDSDKVGKDDFEDSNYEESKEFQIKKSNVKEEAGGFDKSSDKFNQDFDNYEDSGVSDKHKFSVNFENERKSNNVFKDKALVQTLQK